MWLYQTMLTMWVHRPIEGVINTTPGIGDIVFSDVLQVVLDDISQKFDVEFLYYNRLLCILHIRISKLYITMSHEHFRIYDRDADTLLYSITYDNLKDINSIIAAFI